MSVTNLPKSKYGLPEYSFEIGQMDDTSEAVAIVGIEYSDVNPYEVFHSKADVEALLAEKDAKIKELENAPHWDNSQALIHAVEKTKSLEEELAKARDEIKQLEDQVKYNFECFYNERELRKACEEKLVKARGKYESELKKKGASNLRLECEKLDLWLRFVQLRRALCRLRIGFALRLGKANSGKKIIDYWKHRCKTAPYWDSKTYKDIPQTPAEKES